MSSSTAAHNISPGDTVLLRDGNGPPRAFPVTGVEHVVSTFTSWEKIHVREPYQVRVWNPDTKESTFIEKHKNVLQTRSVENPVEKTQLRFSSRPPLVLHSRCVLQTR